MSVTNDTLAAVRKPKIGVENRNVSNLISTACAINPVRQTAGFP